MGASYRRKDSKIATTKNTKFKSRQKQNSKQESNIKT